VALQQAAAPRASDAPRRKEPGTYIRHSPFDMTPSPHFGRKDKLLPDSL